MYKQLFCRLFLLLFSLFSSFYTIQAQSILNNNPASVKWRQIKTPGFKLIYPEEFEAEANNMANTLEHIREPEARTMGGSLPKRIPVVLQNRNAISNGFVTFGPRRSEFYTLPPQSYSFIGTNNWLDLLAIHEYRHIAQFNRTKTGLTKYLSYFFGQNTRAAVSFMAAPRWFWEGDATIIETVATESGRGRIPEWNRVFRANLLGGKRFNYHKQHLGSFKDEVPDHYRLGYYLIGHVRKRTGNAKIWDEISASAFQMPFIPFAFSNAMKKHSGSYLVANYEMMMDDIAAMWSDQISTNNFSDFEVVNDRNDKVFTDYSFPQILEDGSIVAFKDGLSDPGQLIRFDSNGYEVKRFVTGVMNNTAMLSSTQFKVYWNEYEFDPRWRAKTYSVIKTYDFESGEVKNITKKSRYAGAGISPDGYKLVTVLNTIANENHLIILDAISGKELNRFLNPDNAQYGMPSWSRDGKSIVALKITNDGKSVIQLDIESQKEKVLIATSNENIGSPILVGKHLLYSSPLNGVDNIYSLNIDSGVIYRITQSRYGAYSPMVSHDEKTLIYSDHDINGLNIVKTSFNPLSWTPLDQVKVRDIDFINEIVEQEDLTNILDTKPNKKYESKKYSKLGHMFNIHSWGPFLGTDLNRAQVGVFSKDVLSTTRASLGYTYDLTEGTGFASAGISYQGFYPIIDFSYDIGNRKTTSYEWEETTINAGLSLPLILTKSRFFTELSVSNSVGVRDVSNFKQIDSESGRESFGIVNLIDENEVVVDTISVFRLDASELSDGKLIFNNFSINYSNLFKRAPRNIRSRWGQFFVYEQLNTLGGDFEGRTSGLRGGIFLPSPVNLVSGKWFRNHSLNFRFGYQERKVVESLDAYSFRNVIFKPRGYAYPNEQSFASILTNYEFPLLYPDLALGPILYIKRIKANLFYDYGQDDVVRLLYTAEPFNSYRANDLIETENISSLYTSYGAELTFDFNLLRFPINIEMGVRVVNTQSNAWNVGDTSVELLLGGINF